MPYPELVISVVGGADPALLRGFLTSVHQEADGDPWEIVAVLNGSDAPDGSDLPGLGATSVLRRESPLGFAANHNDIMRTHPADYYLLANDDVIVLPHTIERLLAFMKAPENQRVGVVSPKLLNFDGTLQPSTYSFPTLPRIIFAMTDLRERLGTGRTPRLLTRVLGRTDGQSRMWAHDHQVDVDTLRGAFVMVRNECLQAVGPMVEITLVGGEESEWHRRMQSAHWRVVFLPEVAVLHKGHATVNTRPELVAEYLRGSLYFLGHHKGKPSLLMARGAGVLIFGARWLIAALRSDHGGRALARLCLSTLVTTPAT